MNRERRKDFRVEWNTSALMFDERGAEARPCVVRNLSNKGAKVLLQNAASVSCECKLRITEHSPLRSCVIVWRTNEAVGVQFLDVPATPQLSRQGRERLRELQEARRRRVQ
jgi:hypothetical protein